MSSLKSSLSPFMVAVLTAMLIATMSTQVMAGNDDQTQTAGSTDPTPSLNTNPFDIPDERWANMKKLAAKVQKMDKPQPIMVGDEPNPKVVNFSKANFQLLDFSVKHFGVKNGSLGVYLAIMDAPDVSGMSFEQRLQEVAVGVQDIVSRKYRTTGAYIAKILRVAPTEKERARLTEAELTSGLLLFVRGQRNEREIVEGGQLGYIYTDPRLFFADLEAIFDAGVHQMNNAEYYSYVEEYYLATEEIKRWESEIEGIERLQKKLDEISRRQKANRQ